MGIYHQCLQLTDPTWIPQSEMETETNKKESMDALKTTVDEVFYRVIYVQVITTTVLCFMISIFKTNPVLKFTPHGNYRAGI